MIPPIYVICNPKYEVERYKFLLEHFEKRGIPAEKISYIFAPWGSEISNEIYWSVYDPFTPRYGFKQQLCFKASGLLKAEVSLNLTIGMIFEKVCKRDDEIVLVFESDVWLRPDFLQRLDCVLKEAQHREWDIISLGEGVGTRPGGERQEKTGQGGSSKGPGEPFQEYFGPTKLYEHKGFGGFRCCDSMLFKRSFLQRVKETYIPFREISDWELNFQKELHHGKVLWVDPPLAEPGSGRNRNISQLPS